LPRLRRVLLANNRGKAKVRKASENLGGNIGTVFMVTEVFSEQFFAPVRSGEARFNGNPRNRIPQIEHFHYLMVEGPLCK
jgi:hypothetical protein